MARPLLRSPPAVALLAGALAVRLAVVRLTSGYVPHHDDRSYLTYAVAIDRTGGLPVWAHDGVPIPTAYRAPGFPALLAAVRAVAGPELGPLRIAQALVGVVLVALVGVVAAQLWGRRAGLAALALAAVSPPLVLFGASLVSEPLYAALETAAMAAALRARRERHHPLGWALATGALGGAAALTRPAGLVLLPALALVALPRGRPGRARLGAALAVVLAGVAVVSPWTARNARVLHAFVPVSTEAGNTLAGTYNPVSARDPVWPWGWHDPRANGIDRAARAAHRFDEPATDAALRAAALRYVAAHPTAPLEVGLRDGARLAGLAPRAWSRLSLGTVSLGAGGAVQDALRAGLVLTTLLAVAGAAATRRRSPPAGWWVAGALVLAAAALVNGEQRFAVPLQPWLLALGGLALATASERVRPGRRPVLAPPPAALPAAAARRRGGHAPPRSPVPAAGVGTRPPAG